MTPLPRRFAPELMDRPDVASADLEQSLLDLRRVNRWFGGTRTALLALLPLLREIEAPSIRVLDVATGSGDIPVALALAARRRQRSVQVTATDLHPSTVEIARRTVRVPEVEVESADGLALPFGNGHFHIVMCHTALHHFERKDAIRLVAELGRVASHAVVITDLRRCRAGLAAAALFSRTLWRAHPVTRHDGVASFRGAFTAAEAARLFRRAGLPTPRVRHRPFFRFSLVCRLGPSR